MVLSGLPACVNMFPVSLALSFHVSHKNTHSDKLLLSSLLQFMNAVGNDATKAKYEQLVPAFYYRPTHTDCM